MIVSVGNRFCSCKSESKNVLPTSGSYFNLCIRDENTINLVLSKLRSVSLYGAVKVIF